MNKRRYRLCYIKDVNARSWQSFAILDTEKRLVVRVNDTVGVASRLTEHLNKDDRRSVTWSYIGAGEELKMVD